MPLPESLSTWQSLPILQQPGWPDPDAVKAAVEELSVLPPLVFAGEARQLQNKLAAAANGQAFLLQAGDCAESFHDLRAPIIRNKLKIILQMALLLTYGSGLPVVKVGRIAGQFAKPRSSGNETFDGVTLPAFRGHIINEESFTPDARIPDPWRMVSAYQHAASTLNLLRAFTTGGFADLSQIHNWNLDFVASSPQGKAYEEVASEIDRALRFMRAIGINEVASPTVRQVDFYTSHEGLLLDYEDALTRQDSLTGDWYACSAHMLWIGERTRQLDHAHVAFMKSINNPIGCKVGPTMAPDDLVTLCEELNPERTPGRLTFITRMGAKNVDEKLPPLLAAVRDSGHPVVWVCDPMHGNTTTTPSGHKTRNFKDMISEVKAFFAAHREADTWPGGIHLELTGEDVTECTGGPANLREDELSYRYETMCDPRLNAQQGTDLAFRVARLLQEHPKR